MLTRIKCIYYRHFTIPEISRYILGMSLILASVGIFHGSYLYMYEAFSPTTSWYEYGDIAVKPLRLEFKVGENPKFVSDVQYYRNIDMRWEDTLWCYQNGGLKKYKTQRWPESGNERMLAGTSMFADAGENVVPYWEYSAQQIDDYATSCYIRSMSIGRTPFGFEKEFRYTSETFFVNR